MKKSDTTIQINYKLEIFKLNPQILKFYIFVCICHAHATNLATNYAMKQTTKT